MVRDTLTGIRMFLQIVEGRSFVAAASRMFGEPPVSDNARPVDATFQRH